MFRHAIALVDCSDDARRAAVKIVRFFAEIPSCQVTLAATVGPAPTEALRQERIENCQASLTTIGEALMGYGLYTRRCLLEGDDTIAGLAAESRSPHRHYDLIVLDTHHARTDAGSGPSILEQVCRQVGLPVLVLPNHGPAGAGDDLEATLGAKEAEVAGVA